jgi:O-antigen/teichoic acid export membrane protein
MSVKKNVVYNIVLNVSYLLFPLITFPYLSRIIGAEGLGTCNFVLSYCQNYIIIAALGLPVYGIREIARAGDDKQKRSKLFFELLLIHLLFTLLLLVIYVVSLFLNADFQNYKQLTLMAGVFILMNAFAIEWLFAGVSDFQYITIRSLIVRSLSVVAIFVFVKQKEDFNTYFFITIFTAILPLLINIKYAQKYIVWDRTFLSRNIFIHIRPLFILGIYIVLTNVYTLLPTTLLGFYSTKSAVGYFYGADKIIRMTISVFTALTTVIVPKLNQIIEKNGSEEYLLWINKSLVFIISIGLPCSFLIYLLADPIVMLLAGKEFVNSIFCVQLMAPIIMIIAFAQVFVLMILSVNRRDKEMVILSFTGMIVSLAINLIFIRQFAEKATALSQLIAELAVTSLSFFMAKRVLNFNMPGKFILLNLVFMIPFVFITSLCMKITGSIILQLMLSGASCGLYFLIYQLLIIKNKYIMELIDPYYKKLRELL